MFILGFVKAFKKLKLLDNGIFEDLTIDNNILLKDLINFLSNK
jgi:hypothetical protein